jgi:uncharacterized protein (DUF1697 family)
MTGHNSIKMSALTELYKNIGIYDAETYIQSGNVVFNIMNEMAISEISAKIEKIIRATFDYTVPVMIRTVGEMKRIISVNPYLTEENFDQSKMAVIFLYENPSEEQLQKANNIYYPPDKFQITGREIFIYCPNGFGKTKLYTNFFEKKMNVIGTARNWKTITTLLNIAEKKQS